MIKEVRETTKHSVIYAVSSILMKVVGLILLPIYTDLKYLSYEDYGVLTLLETTLQVLVSLMAFSMDSSLTRWYWDKKYINRQSSIFFTSFTTLVAFILPSIVVLSLLSGSLSNLIFDTPEYANLLKLIAICAALQITNNHILALAKARSNSLLYAAISIGRLIISLGIIIWGVVINKGGVEYILYGYTAGEAVVLAISSIYAVRNMSPKFEISIIKEMLVYGAPIMLSTVAGILISSTDKYMINSMSGVEDTGLYSFGYKIANTLKMVVIMPLTFAITPLNMKKIGVDGNQHFYSKVATYSLLIYSIAWIALSLFSYELIDLVSQSENYISAVSFIPIIGMALLFVFLRLNLTIGLIVKKKTKILGALVFGTGILNVILNRLLIPILGIYGAALSTLLSHMAFSAAVYYYAQREYPIKYEVGKIALIIVVSTIAIAVGMPLNDYNLFIRIAIKLALIVSFPFILNIFKFYDSEEKRVIREVASTWRDPKLFKSNIKRVFK